MISFYVVVIGGTKETMLINLYEMSYFGIKGFNFSV